MAKSPQPYKLQYLPLFWDDLNTAVSYICDVLKSPEAANRLLDSTEKRILEHLSNPASAAIYKSAKQRPLSYYWFEVGSYMVFYVVFDNIMEVRRFIYGARDLTKMLP